MIISEPGLRPDNLPENSLALSRFVTSRYSFDGDEENERNLFSEVLPGCPGSNITRTNWPAEKFIFSSAMNLKLSTVGVRSILSDNLALNILI